MPFLSENIVRLQITMNYVFIMQCLYSLGNLQRKIVFIFRELYAFQYKVPREYGIIQYDQERSCVAPPTMEFSGA